VPSNEFEAIRYEVKDNIASVVLNRPEKMNAINSTMSKELNQAIELAGADPDVRVIVIRGEGRCFSAGADLFEKTEQHSLEELMLRHTTPAGRHYWSIWNVPKPVIASVHSYCLAGALWVTQMCDLTIAGESALFGSPVVRFAQHPSIHPPVLTLKLAKEMALTGKAITAERAERIGLVNRVVPDADLLEETYAWARELAELPALGLGLAKRAINRVYESGNYAALSDLGAELLSYANELQAVAGADNGFRDEVRRVGVSAAVKKRDNRD
jgi:enoyl-CoA hydratase/carnithine racemase